jgi:hypothetical protein
MFIARTSRSKEKGEILILGLTRENLSRLQQTQPIHIRRQTHGDGIPEGWEIIIIFGESERAIISEFEKAGMIDPETTVHVDPRL